jgi:hypothetical protein
LRKKGIEVERSKSGKRNITIRKTAKITDEIVQTVQRSEINKHSGGNVVQDSPVTPRKVDNRDDGVDKSQKNPERHLSAGGNSSEATREQGEL